MQTFPEITKAIENKLQQDKYQTVLSSFQKALSQPEYRILAVQLGEWNKKYVKKSPTLRKELADEMTALEDYLKEKKVTAFYLGIQQKKTSYYLELLGILFGLVMICFGILAEIDHHVSVGYTDEMLRVVETGASQALFGVVLVVGCGAVLYGKVKGKWN